MIPLRFKHHALAAAGACLLAACGGPQSSFAPAGTTQAPPAAQAYARSLLYMNLNAGVELYTYPRGKPLGSLGLGGYLCSDRFGNVVIAGAAGVSYVWVYPHGGNKPIQAMFNPESPGGCSVDPSSEDIAVASPFADTTGTLVIFPYNPKRGWRLAHIYHDSNMYESDYCTYDPQGDVFLDGATSRNVFVLAEMPKGSSTFSTITLDRVIHRPGSLQWDGNELAIEDAGETSQSEAVIYRFAISGSTGHLVRATTLMSSVAYGQYIILGRTIIGPTKQNSVYGLGFWPYPKGGAPGRTLSTDGEPAGEALSPK